MPAIVERNDPAAVLRQRAHPLRIDPISRRIGRKTMDKKDRLARTLIQIGDLYAVGIKTLHSLVYRIASGVTMLALSFFNHRRTECHGSNAGAPFRE